MKSSSDQAGILPPPSIIDILIDFMTAEGFDMSLFKVVCQGVVWEYDGWQLGGIARSGQFYMIPFATNDIIYLNPADPKFFENLKEALRFPTTGDYKDVWRNGRWAV